MNSNDPQMSVYMCYLKLDSEWGGVPPELSTPQNLFDNIIFAIWSKEIKHVYVDIPIMYTISLFYVSMSFTIWLKSIF